MTLNGEEDQTTADRPLMMLGVPWHHDGYEGIRVVIPRSLRAESRRLATCFRGLRKANSIDEVRAEADRIADSEGLQLTWTTEPDEANAGGRLMRIAVRSAAEDG